MTSRGTLATRQLAVLFAVAGLLSALSLARPDPHAVAWPLIAVAALVSAGLAVTLPWTRWGHSSELLLLGPAFALIGAATSTHLLPSRTYGSLFILLFAWVGAHRPPRTALWVLPFAALAYVLPLVATPPDIPFSPPGAIVTLSVCLLVAEALARTVSARTKAQQEAARSAETMRQILDSSPQPTVALDLHGCVTVANRAAAAALAFRDEEQLIGRELHDVMHHTMRDGSPYPAGDCPLFAAMSAGMSAQLDGELFFRADGEAFFADFRLEPVRHGDETVGAVCTFLDVTQRRRIERETQERLYDSERAAATDALTGIGNRRQAEAFLAAAMPGDAVVLLDIDHFKAINDSAGHAAGDEVLRSLAQHLAGQIRSNDHLARFGGEEFVLLLSRGSSTAVAVVERMARSWKEISAGVTFSVGVSVHVAGHPMLETLAAADRALYAAKEQGRDRVVAADDYGTVRA